MIFGYHRDFFVSYPFSVAVVVGYALNSLGAVDGSGFLLLCRAAADTIDSTLLTFSFNEKIEAALADDRRDCLWLFTFVVGFCLREKRRKRLLGL